ncbi:conserved hypothetical protein [Methylocella silvestris BL2]|uniref:Uncharacterized protein n=1 Tax=Methylocella silvestris (strain DSM 15510 / CIP 108128 / LMG 27833 / NCIMB 13906 / BL2) TaxID=395965 RepID=B8EP49_METSB|nr:hypothetical protein [Methylocella silvestris]ACK49287.1 conserved hypothetical protein [Methylocella silvestris BL2]
MAQIPAQNSPSPANLATPKPINWLHLSTIVAVAILVGTEMVGASWAAGWAIGGLLQLDPSISRLIEIGFTLCGFVLLYFFMRIAIRHEPIRG